MQMLAATVDLDENGCYKDAPVASANSALKKQCEQLNHMTGVEITYTFGDKVEVLDGNTIKDWLVMENDTLDVDPALVREMSTSGNPLITVRPRSLARAAVRRSSAIGGTWGPFWRQTRTKSPCKVVKRLSRTSRRKRAKTGKTPWTNWRRSWSMAAKKGLIWEV